MLVDREGRPAEDGGIEARMRAFAAVLRGRAETFEHDPSRAGFDVIVRNEARGFKNRARIKAFFPTPHAFVLFFYKDAQTPGSDDRFAYGAYVSKGPAPDPKIVEACVDYAVSGLHPERRPRELKRAFSFDVPR